MASYDDLLTLAKKHLSTPSSSPPTSSPISIHAIPSKLRNFKPQAYTPRVVSIGLINFEKLRYMDMDMDRYRYMDMDRHKEIYMSNVIQRISQNSGSSIDEIVQLFVDSMKTKARDVMNCYPHKLSLDPEIVTRTMILDGCFILELLTRWANWSTDPIIQNRSDLNNVVHDLLLLENQIPLFVLQILIKLNIHGMPLNKILEEGLSDFLNSRLILNFFCNESNSHFKSVKIPSGSFHTPKKVHHMLGLVHSYYVPQSLPKSSKSEDYNFFSFSKKKPGDHMAKRYLATDIFRSGIKFKPSKHIRFRTPCLFYWFPIITTSIFLFPMRLAIFIYQTIFYSSPHSASRKLPLFMPAREEYEMKSARASCCWLSIICQLCGRATLEIPELHITDSTESFLRNLIAYEQTSKDIPNYITSYVFLMDKIINTKEDIQTLETSGVLRNYLGSSEVALDFFNHLCIDVTLDEEYFSEPCKQVDAYCKLYWANLFGLFKVTYFSNPWTGISVFAALVLFAFTGLQTACTVIQTWYS